MDEQNLQLLWRSYLEQLPKNYLHRLNRIPDAWSFGNSPTIADRLGKLVLTGLKTATCKRYLGENILDEDRLSIILNGNKNPICIIETYEIKIKRYKDVDAEFAKAEGEGDLSLDYWRKVHWDFFSREAETENYRVNENMLLSCERFRVVYTISDIKFTI